MFLYNISLQKTSAIIHTVYGNFSSPKAQEVVISRGKSIELLRPDENGKLQTVVSTEMFAVIRSLLAFRLTGISFNLSIYSILNQSILSCLVSSVTYVLALISLLFFSLTQLGAAK